MFFLLTFNLCGMSPVQHSQLCHVLHILIHQTENTGTSTEESSEEEDEEEDEDSGERHTLNYLKEIVQNVCEICLFT